MILRRIILLLLSVLFATPAMTTVAQTPAATYPPDADQLAGIQAAVFRDYASAGAFSGGNGTFDNATPLTGRALTQGRVNSITVFVYEFDTVENAAVAFDRLSAGLLGSLANLSEEGSQQITAENLTSIGTQASLARLVLTSENQGTTRETTFEYITIQCDHYVFVVSSRRNRGPVDGPLPDPGDDASPTLPLAKTLAATGKPADGDVTFDANGESTGGLWDFMPAAGDDVLLGLVPGQDTILFPMPVA